MRVKLERDPDNPSRWVVTLDGSIQFTGKRPACKAAARGICRTHGIASWFNLKDNGQFTEVKL